MSFTSTQASFGNTHISIPLGIFIGLFASFIQSLGLTIQRKSHVINQSLPQHSQLVEHRRPLWLLGFSVFILSNLVGSLVQIASLPVVILAPLGAVSLLWNAFFARLILGDVFSPWMILGTVLIAGGAVLIAIFGIVPEPTHSLKDLLELFKRPAFVIYFSLLGIVVFACLAVTHISEYSWSRKFSNAPESEYSPPLVTARCDIYPPHTSELNNTAFISDDSYFTERTPLLHGNKGQAHSSSYNADHLLLDPMDRVSIFLAISYASVSGIISGMCLIFAKSGVELLLLTIGGQNQFRHWESWALVLGLVVFALLQLWYLHKALILANPTLVCPSAFCFYNLSSIVNGLVYFNQLQLIKPVYLCLVALGIVILLSGVWVVSIQSGGGGINIGTWDGGEQDISDGDVSASTVGLERDDVPPLDPWRRDFAANSPVRAVFNRTPTFSPGSMEGETRSESHITLPQASNDSSPEMGVSGSRSSIPERHRTRSMNLYMAPRSPPQTRPSHRRTTEGSETRQISHRRNPSHSSNMFSPPLNNTVSTLGAGLQIGLSPISPGFIIVPRERRRGLNVLENGDMEQDLHSHERRTLSEGDVRAPSGPFDIPSLPRALSDDGETSTGEPSLEHPNRRRGRAPWRYFQDVLKATVHKRS